MKASLNRAAALGEVKPQEQRLSGLIGAVRDPQATLNDLEGGDWLLKCASEAIDAVMQRKLAAAEMKIDAGLMTNQLNGIGHMSLRRVGLLPQEFFEEWIDRVRAHFNMDNEQERLDRAFEGLSRCLDQIRSITRKGTK